MKSKNYTYFSERSYTGKDCKIDDKVVDYWKKVLGDNVFNNIEKVYNLRPEIVMSKKDFENVTESKEILQFSELFQTGFGENVKYQLKIGEKGAFVFDRFLDHFIKFGIAVLNEQEIDECIMDSYIDNIIRQISKISMGMEEQSRFLKIALTDLNDYKITRLAGLIDWHSIVDRTRNLRGNGHWDKPEDVIASARYSYLLNKWDGQPNYVEVWVEKDALVDIVGQACIPLDTPYFSCRGYTSQSEMWSAAQRFIDQSYRDNRYIIHLGDHDPSGIDMTRDIQERLRMFGADVYVKRVALTMNQIETYNPPPNPAKLSDSRCGKYIDEYGDESWELDALEPSVITNLITNEVTGSDTTSSYAAATGSTASLGNGTGRAEKTTTYEGGVAKEYTVDGKTSVCWRGKENFWGNLWKFVYGINIWGNGKMGGGQPYICSDFSFAESKNSGNY